MKMKIKVRMKRKWLVAAIATLLLVATTLTLALCMGAKMPKEVLLGAEWISLDDLQENPKVKINQSMMLVNTKYMLGQDFVPAVSQYKESGVYMNDCMIMPYAILSAAVTKETEQKLYVSSHFRSAEKQEELYREDPDTATVPGASEHQAGLCVDVYVSGYAGDGFARSAAGKFIAKSGYRYGFILRYPSYGEDSTGIRYEPWHIRYVGAPHAEIITKNRLTLEEYIEGMEIGTWYAYGDYCICRQTAIEDGGLYLPDKWESAVISPDNTGCYLITLKNE